MTRPLFLAIVIVLLHISACTPPQQQAAGSTDSCSTCIQICHVLAADVLVCKVECKDLQPCALHDVKEEARKKATSPPLLAPPPAKNDEAPNPAQPEFKV